MCPGGVDSPLPSPATSMPLSAPVASHTHTPPPPPPQELPPHPTPPPSCSKWRVVPPSVVFRQHASVRAGRPHRWCCGDNTTDPARASCAAPEEPRAKDASAEQFYNVEAILDERTDPKGNARFLVRWEGYGSEDDQWLQQGDLNQKLIDAFRNRQARRQEGSSGRRRGEGVPAPKRPRGGGEAGLPRRKRTRDALNIGSAFMVDLPKEQVRPRLAIPNALTPSP